MRAGRGVPAWIRLLLRLHSAEFRARFGAEAEASAIRTLELERAKRGVSSRLAAVRCAADLLGSAVRSRFTTASGRRPALSPAEWLRDVRHAGRSLARQPLFALAVIATMAVGIGASTMVFSMVYGFLFRPLPFEDPDRLVMLWSRNDARGWTRTDVSLRDVRDWQARTTVFDGVAVIDRATFTLSGDGDAERLVGAAVTHDLLDVLGVPPLMGRDFAAADGRPGAPGVVLLTDALWRRRFGADPAIVGRTIRLDGSPHTVVGVMPPDFRFLDTQPDLMVALREDLATESRGDHSSMAIARLAGGVSIERAEREVARVADALEREHPETNEGWGARVVLLRDDALQAEGRAAATVLGGAIIFVLLMVCVNLANLLLARGRSRRRELAVRSALGASRGRLTRQLLTESLVLALIGGSLGAAASFAGVGAVVGALPPELPPVFEFTVDLPVLVFALSVTVLATFAFGLLPAVRDSRADASVLREEDRRGGGRRGRRFGSALIVVQTALAVVLLAGGVTLSRSVVHLHTQELGYEPNGLLTFRISPPESDYPDVEATSVLHDAIVTRLSEVPGVVALGAIHSLPLRGANSVGTFTVSGDANVDGWPARLNWITPGYTDAIRLPVLAGRAIGATDRADGARVVVVNEMLARQRFGDTDAVGRTIGMGGEQYTVVGVVANALDRSVVRPAEPSLYFAAAQHGVRSLAYALRTTGDPAALAPVVRRELAAVDPDLPPYELRPFVDLVADRLMPFSLIAAMMLGFAIISVLLCAIGLYGVTAFGVGRRTHEIGLRLAVGAQRAGIVRMIVGEGMRRALVGVAIGIVAAVPLAGAMRAIAVGVDPADPLTFGFVALSLLAIALLGSWLPARRAAGLDPMRTLGAE